MTLWVIGIGMLLGVHAGVRKNRRTLFEIPIYRDIPSLTGEKGIKNYTLIYLRGGGKRSIKRKLTVACIITLVIIACLFFGIGKMSFAAQLLSAVWMWYFMRLLTSTLSSPGVIRYPVMVLTGNGLWLKDNDNPYLRQVPWENVSSLTVMNSKGTMVGGVIEKTFSFSPRRVEIDFTDGSVYAADGVSGNIMPIADKFSLWLPVRKVRME